MVQGHRVAVPLQLRNDESYKGFIFRELFAIALG